MNVKDVTQPFVRELMLMAKMNYLSICLVKEHHSYQQLSYDQLHDAMYLPVNETYSLMRWDQYDLGRIADGGDVRCT
ncbi:hypothetical protein CKAN_00666100 [Cinnamomum micranthum f. kanehirae]|uniref:Uncharacterized protein n=1 Tax=Cinnamomum micranthum f. kanehirae TaxID=337451 RepID=A0A443NI34_9MAGN|nr:hypothetical protein CKAN_00666100 [Cinnamomum micranthum f. kanehirae]